MGMATEAYVAVIPSNSDIICLNGSGIAAVRIVAVEANAAADFEGSRIFWSHSAGCPKTPCCEFNLSIRQLSPLIDDSGVSALGRLIDKFANLGTRYLNRQRERGFVAAIGHPFGKITWSIDHIVSPSGTHRQRWRRSIDCCGSGWNIPDIHRGRDLPGSY
jgi:hypothetical protein